MRTRAAVALEAGKPLEVMEVNLEGAKGWRGSGGNQGNRPVSYR